jgi:recombination protein RecR
MSESFEPISRMTQELSRLPGIGQKTAQRLAYFVASMPLEDVRALAVALWEGRKAIRFCSRCGNYASGELCPVCADPRRQNGQICVVRDPRDVAALERMHDYAGTYHVLHGTLSPMDGVGPDDLNVSSLLTRIQSEPVSEVILATNPDVEGEATASYLSRLLKPLGVRCTRIAHGVPVGGDLEYTDEVTLLKALEGRREV